MGKNNKFSLASKSHSTRVNPYDKITLNALNVSCPDKHIVLPKLDNNGFQHVFIELYSLFIFIIALGSQYLNLYRTSWWYARNKSSQPINYHLIDLDASQFSLLLIGQSSLITLIRALMRNSSKFNLTTQRQQAAPSSSVTSLSSSTSSPHPNSCSGLSTTPNNQSQTPDHHKSQQSSITNGHNSINYNGHHSINNAHNSSHQNSSSNIKGQPCDHEQNISSITTIVTATASWICNYYLFKCAYRIWNNTGLNGLSFISYPIVVSIILKTTHIIQVIEDCKEKGKLTMPFLALSMTVFSSHIKFDDNKLCHNCSNQPDEIRDEVERFRTIFNERLKFILFKSILLTYYSSFVPLCFAQDFLYYDYTWTAQHVAITWFSSLIMLISSSYTPYFYDVLHRSAYHFGKWQRLEARNTLVPCINWSENVIYPQGVVVKHYKGYFRSESVSNCAQPGLSSHLRYHIVFSNPKIGYAAPLALLSLLLVFQMYLLLISTEWYKLVAMTNMMLINVHSIFRLVKSLVVITKIYKEKH